MCRPRFLADNDLNDAIVAGVRRREPGMEFSRLRDLGVATSRDPEVLKFADRVNWIVVPHDVNTMREVACTRLGAGLSMDGCFSSTSAMKHLRSSRACFSTGPRVKRRNGPTRLKSFRIEN
jgi:hypothetical protein